MTIERVNDIRKWILKLRISNALQLILLILLVYDNGTNIMSINHWPRYLNV